MADQTEEEKFDQFLTLMLQASHPAVQQGFDRLTRAMMCVAAQAGGHLRIERSTLQGLNPAAQLFAIVDPATGDIVLTVENPHVDPDRGSDQVGAAGDRPAKARVRKARRP